MSDDQHEIDTGTLWAWVTEYPNGTVGQVGAMTSDGGHLSLTTRSRYVAYEAMRPLAAAHAKATGQRVWLREYRAYLDHEEA